MSPACPAELIPALTWSHKQPCHKAGRKSGNAEGSTDDAELVAGARLSTDWRSAAAAAAAVQGRGVIVGLMTRVISHYCSAYRVGVRLEKNYPRRPRRHLPANLSDRNNPPVSPARVILAVRHDVGVLVTTTAPSPPGWRDQGSS
ncbi:hypothetical protein Bbelb_435360 [Branchiostoma belcheri]|nr:hypothetical protein Bbelb_435360 [Branchiostoma belcheri]